MAQMTLADTERTDADISLGPCHCNRQPVTVGPTQEENQISLGALGGTHDATTHAFAHERLHNSWRRCQLHYNSSSNYAIATTPVTNRTLMPDCACCLSERLPLKIRDCFRGCCQLLALQLSARTLLLLAHLHIVLASGSVLSDTCPLTC
jgi:hypothetical protein